MTMLGNQYWSSAFACAAKLFHTYSNLGMASASTLHFMRCVSTEEKATIKSPREYPHLLHEHLGLRYCDSILLPQPVFIVSIVRTQSSVSRSLVLN